LDTAFSLVISRDSAIMKTGMFQAAHIGAGRFLDVKHSTYAPAEDRRCGES
jgi:hypothetical protein